MLSKLGNMQFGKEGLVHTRISILSAGTGSSTIPRGLLAARLVCALEAMAEMIQGKVTDKKQTLIKKIVGLGPK